MSALPSTVLRSPDVLREVLHYVRNGADFLRCELVCVAWRQALGEDALWEPQPIGYGDALLLPCNILTRLPGRRGVLELPAILAVRRLQKNTQVAFRSVLGTVKMRRVVESLYNRCCLNDDPRPRLTDGAVLALCEVVETWMGEILDCSNVIMLHRSLAPEANDDFSIPSLSEAGGTVGAVDMQLHFSVMLRTSSYDRKRLEFYINNFFTETLPHLSEQVNQCFFPLKHGHLRKSLLSELVPEFSSSELARIARRIARRAGVIGITAAAMEIVCCYCVGAIGALLKHICILHGPDFSHSYLPPDDDDDYSSVNETDDETMAENVASAWAAHLVDETPPSFPPKPVAQFTVTSESVAYAAEVLGVASGYYPSDVRSDVGDGDSDSSEAEPESDDP